MSQHNDDTTRYTANGYKDRDDYLTGLADDRGIDSMAVHMIADMLGPSEDFDGLVSELEDFEYLGFFESFNNEEADDDDISR
jgi:hypothetical protein